VFSVSLSSFVFIVGSMILKVSSFINANFEAILLFN
jgi:hypothetical protein